MSGGERRVVEGEMFGAPVPEGWPGGKKRDATDAEDDATEHLDKGPSWLDRLVRRRPAQ